MANPEALRIEDLVAQAIQEGKLIQGINDPETVAKAGSSMLGVSGSDLSATGNFRDAVHEAWFRQGSARENFSLYGRALVKETENVRDEPSPEVELIAKALRIAGSPERLAEWMSTPVPALNGQTPYSLMQTEDGRKQVEDVLGRIEHGVY